MINSYTTLLFIYIIFWKPYCDVNLLKGNINKHRVVLVKIFPFEFYLLKNKKNCQKYYQKEMQKLSKTVATKKSKNLPKYEICMVFGHFPVPLTQPFVKLWSYQFVITFFNSHACHCIVRSHVTFALFSHAFEVSLSVRDFFYSWCSGTVILSLWEEENLGRYCLLGV